MPEMGIQADTSSLEFAREPHARGIVAKGGGLALCRGEYRAARKEHRSGRKAPTGARVFARIKEKKGEERRREDREKHERASISGRRFH